MSSESQFALLSKKRFGPFFWTQALGAFNDNVFKNALVIMIAFAPAISTADANLYVNAAAGLFILPFFLFSATFGQVAEKYEKSMLIRRIKLLEVAIMVTALLGFWTGQLGFLLLVLFLMGTQSALFGPVKYGILPQHLHEKELVGGNGLVEMGTFLAILLGTMAGGWIVAQAGGPRWIGAAVIAIAIFGWWTSRGIPLAPAAAPDLRINYNPFTETWRNMVFMRGNRVVLLSVLGISWFWFYGATVLSQLPNYTRIVLGGDETVVTLLLTLFSLGVGIGSLLCERMSGHKIEIGLVPFGSIGLSLFAADLYFARTGAAEVLGQNWQQFLGQPGAGRVVLDLLMIGLFGGFYIVPLYALIQSRSEPTHRSRIIAGNNMLNALFMVASAIMAIVLLNAGLSIPQLLLTVAVMNAAVTMFIFTLVPEFLMRFLVWLLISALYRVRTENEDTIPDEGAAVLVCNHVSFVDALILGGTIRRPVRFVTYYKIYRLPVLNWIFRTARAIPIAGSKEDPALMEQAFADIAAALEAGELVCIFPEGGLSPNGKLQTFRPGIERIIQRTPVPVIPMALTNLWRSMWSRRWLRLRMQRARLPRRLRARIGLIVGAAIPPQEATAEQLQLQVATLRGADA